MARRQQPTYSSERPSLEYLSHPGPHQVAAGELTPIGMGGVVFAPTTGPRFPAVVFGHGLLQPVGRYADTLRYLASWGFVAAAPATEGGPLPSHGGLALDLSRTLDRLAEAKLGGGRVTVDRNRMALAGHGIGAGASVLAAAAAAPPVTAVVTISASPTSPSAVDAAGRVTVPGMHLVGTEDHLTTPSAEGDAAPPPTGEAIARAWGGPSQLRQLKGTAHLGVTEGSHWTSFLLGTMSSPRTQRSVRTLLTAFFLLHTAGQAQLADEIDGEIAGTRAVDLLAAS